MKNLLKYLAIAAVILAGPRWGFAATRIEGGTLLDSTGLAYDLTGTAINTDAINTLSMLAVYSTGTFSAATISDGVRSTATITVSNVDWLSPRSSTGTIDVMSASTSTLAGQYVTINGVRCMAGPGGEWTAVLTATGNAVALAACLTSKANTTNAGWTAVANSTTVTVQTISSGTYFNTWTLVTNSSGSFRFNASNSTGTTLTNGRDRARLAIQNVVLDAGIDYTVAATSSGTAKAISDAIMGRSALSSIIVATWTTGGIVASTSLVSGVNAYTLATSTPGALRLNGSSTNSTDTFLNGSASAIASSVFTKSAHGLTLGLPVLMTTSAGTAPQNLVAGTTYFVIRTDANNFKLASTKANAVAGTSLTVSTFTGAGSFVFTPLAIATVANNGFKFQVSNDNSNYFDLAVTSVTLTSSSNSSTFWDLGTPAYRWIRALFVGPTSGGYAVTITANGRQN